MAQRNLVLERPLVFFDLETTGVDVLNDRIVQIAIRRLVPGPMVVGDADNITWLVNPMIHIPESATAIHGITNDDVAGEPTFAEIANDVADLFHGADVCGHNIIRFDIPLLSQEMKRAGVPFAISGSVVDTLRIFNARFRHTLECAHRLYVGTPMEGAHNARADVQAVSDILIGMLGEYDDLPNEPGLLAKTPPSPDYVDAEGKFLWYGQEVVFGFGSKTLGRPLKEIAKTDPSFLQWMLRQDFDETTMKIVRNALANRFPVREAANGQ
jgi:DNA polymerase-3 subunit epsilon